MSVIWNKYHKCCKERGGYVCFPPQQESNSFSLRASALNRRHSADGTVRSRSGPARGHAGRFHPYRRQFSDRAAEPEDRLHQCASSFNDLQEVCSPDTCSCSSNVPTMWEQYQVSESLFILMGTLFCMKQSYTMTIKIKSKNRPIK